MFSSNLFSVENGMAFCFILGFILVANKFYKKESVSKLVVQNQNDFEFNETKKQVLRMRKQSSSSSKKSQNLKPKPLAKKSVSSPPKQVNSLKTKLEISEFKQSINEFIIDEDHDNGWETVTSRKQRRKSKTIQTEKEVPKEHVQEILTAKQEKEEENTNEEEVMIQKNNLNKHHSDVMDSRNVWAEEKQDLINETDYFEQKKDDANGGKKHQKLKRSATAPPELTSRKIHDDDVNSFVETPKEQQSDDWTLVTRKNKNRSRRT